MPVGYACFPTVGLSAMMPWRRRFAKSLVCYYADVCARIYVYIYMWLVGYACFPTVENLGINAGGIRVFPHCRSLSNNALEASVKIGTFMLQEQAYMLQCWQVY